MILVRRVVVDTNVLISALLHAGVPGQVLAAATSRKFVAIASPEILSEYERAGLDMKRRFPNVAFSLLITGIITRFEAIIAPPLESPRCRDPNDDKFIACALAGRAIIVSGDKDLLSMHGTSGLTVLTPRQFVDKYLLP